MKKLMMLMSAVALTACAPNSSSKSQVDTANSSKIVGGDVVQAGSLVAQHTVALFDRAKSALCSGTLISDSLVLTAAHCVSNNGQSMIVVFATDLHGAAEATKRAVKYAIVNEGYSEEKSLASDTHDIALVKFEGGLPQGYAPAPILQDFSKLQQGTTVRVAGYGLNWSWVVKRGEGILRTTELNIKDPNYSQSEVSLSQSLRKGICSGDSGGPAYLEVNGQLYVWGVTSRSDSMPIPLTPDCFIFSVFTKVGSYTQWIANTAQVLMTQH
jgi:secreted trypsin-like serine protease